MAIPKSLNIQLARAADGVEDVLTGWVKSKRTSKNASFLMLNDGSTMQDVQIVVDAMKESLGKVLDRVGTGAAVKISGNWSKSPGSGQDFELQASQIEVLGEAPADYPLQKKGHTLEFLRDIAHLRARTNTMSAVLRTRAFMAQSVHNFFRNEGFSWVHTPVLTASDCEGAGEMFRVTNFDLTKIPKNKDGSIDYSRDFFGEPAHLTVSGQLEGEALALALKKIYTFGPTFRAENSNTSRHLAEFWMIEPEVAFCDLEGDMQLAEAFVRHLLSDTAKSLPQELKFFNQYYKSMNSEELLDLSQKNFVRLSYTEAVKELKSSGASFEYPVEWGKDLQAEHEKYLTDVVFKGPVIVYNYPKEIKAFYMRVNDDGKTVAAMDVLVPRIGEIIGGSQREDRIDVLEARMREFKIEPESLRWYIDLRKYGGCPHAGFGAGFERLVQYVTGMANIRDTTAFPRVPGWIKF